ncbi:Dabb family protein [Rhizobium sp. LjRoot254]|uniref:Dabb family protein n=1 Tax=Rhizobium sp. LjRoot254 TaxID=3342297 RepID=UPI003ECFE17E
MIRHIVFFSARDKSDLDTIRKGLSLLTEIPHASVLEIGENVKTDQLGGEVDLVVYGEFADADALAAYKAHENYQRSIEIVRPLREIRIAADYDTDGAVKAVIDMADVGHEA